MFMQKVRKRLAFAKHVASEIVATQMTIWFASIVALVLVQHFDMCEPPIE
jgi:hypothetical protein